MFGLAFLIIVSLALLFHKTSLNQLILQQNGAPLHFAVSVIEYLNQTFLSAVE